MCLDKKYRVDDELAMYLANSYGQISTVEKRKRGAVIFDFKGEMLSFGNVKDMNPENKLPIWFCPIHATEAAIAKAARNGKALEGTTIYLTHFPCPSCVRLILESGIQEIVYMDGTNMDREAAELLKDSDIKNVRQYHLKDK